MTDHPLLVVVTTVGTEVDARRIAETVVGESLAACVQIVPGIESVYRWQGAVQREREYQLVMKTAEHRLAALEVRLAALHPYELPELVVLRGEASVAYGRWVNESVR